jgi:hypothetical protein
MSYQSEVKQTPAIDGSKVLPYDQLNAELFYLGCKKCRNNEYSYIDGL